MRRSLLLVTLLAACGDDNATPDASTTPIDAEVDATPGIDADPLMPGLLRDTGLYSDWDSETLADDVYAFAPDPILWSDGATKRRWIYLPPQTTIDTSDMDYWKFPEGTKLWKEFTTGTTPTRVETRLLQKVGPEDGDWFEVAFVWNEAQDEAVANPFGEMNALGTEHDVPTRSQCRGCHDHTPSRVLGFQAIALDHPSSGNGDLVLADVIAMGWLSNPPPSAGIGDYFPLPGAQLDQDALAYLHVNCGGCHNSTYDISTVNNEFRLSVGALTTVGQTSTGMTAIGQPNNLTVAGATAIIEPSNPGASAVYLRMGSTNPAIMMPPIGHELVDTDATQLMSDWITSLPP